ncbi:Alcohol dehydrogenase superfamily zinc-containing [Macrophomina phaseolina MS6]|uniref:Alcohol dehydrogenase superfamily zinc-containing n=1 Tax=Macrophomina phaseolina (strain MS6) TaxID=1126212 RepID=K2SWS9_MACPH|nr:Alcohol dehydrogenase superfamily zinc-containing [Macrophomina phaseolina MS6]
MGSIGSPTTNRALWLSSFTSPLKLIDLPVPEATAGSVVVKVLNTVIPPYTESIHNGELAVFNLKLPLVPHPSHIGRVHAVGSDAVLLKPGDLIYFSAPITARDDPDVNIIQGHHGGEHASSIRLMQGEWRDGALQQYQKIPLENAYLLDEQRLCHELGYTPADLHELSFYSIGVGALLEGAALRAGETIIIGPTTGTFGGISCELALAMGAGRVIALGRNGEKLARLRKQLGGDERLRTVVMTGDVEADAKALREATPSGRGAENIKIIGKVVVGRPGIEAAIQMVNSSLIKLGKRGRATHAVFKLEEHEKAFREAKKGGFKVYTDIAPNPW